jgi:hypothetical protein
VAIVSHFMMPKMIFRRYDASGFEHDLKASVTFSGIAPPPTSRISRLQPEQTGGVRSPWLTGAIDQQRYLPSG